MALHDPLWPSVAFPGPPLSLTALSTFPSISPSSLTAPLVLHVVYCSLFLLGGSSEAPQLHLDHESEPRLPLAVVTDLHTHVLAHWGLFV